MAFTTYPKVWINTDDFSTVGLIFNGVGCLFWVIAYAAIVHTMIKKKFVEMPFFIAAGNLAWELVWSTIYFPDTGILFAIQYQGAFLLDCFIFYYVWKYGADHIKLPELKKNFKVVFICCFIGWLPVNYFFVKNGFDTSIGANSGFILNIIISVLYPVVMIQTGAQYFSKTVAWSKMLGTGLITVSLFFFYPENYFVQTLGIIVLILDCFYIYLLNLFQKKAV
ncbi:MAG: hypothetical protein ACKOXB_03440 [Flavobacteriales bacterium]